MATDTKLYGDMIGEVKETHDAIIADGKTVGYNTAINPSIAGGAAATFAIENKIPPNVMPGVIDMAMRDASIHASTSGKKVSSSAFKAFLDNAYIKSTVGDDALFAGSNAEVVSGLFSQYGNALKTADPEKFGKMNSTVLSGMIVSHARPRWNELDPELREEWEASAKNRTGQTGFTLYLQSELADGIQEGGI